MAYERSDSWVLPCGSVASFDFGSGYGFRCEGCGAVIGSIGMPKSCADMLKEVQAKGEQK